MFICEAVKINWNVTSIDGSIIGPKTQQNVAYLLS